MARPHIRTKEVTCREWTNTAPMHTDRNVNPPLAALTKKRDQYLDVRRLL
jgi:hypothetical protein